MELGTSGVEYFSCQQHSLGSNGAAFSTDNPKFERPVVPLFELEATLGLGDRGGKREHLPLH
jgi:hypothetical protein